MYMRVGVREFQNLRSILFPDRTNNTRLTHLSISICISVRGFWRFTPLVRSNALIFCLLRYRCCQKTRGSGIAASCSSFTAVEHAPSILAKRNAAKRLQLGLSRPSTNVLVLLFMFLVRFVCACIFTISFLLPTKTIRCACEGSCSTWIQSFMYGEKLYSTRRYQNTVAVPQC